MPATPTARRAGQKSKSGAPRCVFCHRSGDGVLFNIFTPRFKPFGTACIECEAKLPEGTQVPAVNQEEA